MARPERIELNWDWRKYLVYTPESSSKELMWKFVWREKKKKKKKKEEAGEVVRDWKEME